MSLSMTNDVTFSDIGTAPTLSCKSRRLTLKQTIPLVASMDDGNADEIRTSRNQKSMRDLSTSSKLKKEFAGSGHGGLALASKFVD